MPSLITDPSFYAVAIPAVVLVGLAKGGLGGAMGFLGVPLMALVISPVQAAAILLPILVLMDVVSLWSWRGYYDTRTLAIVLPGALLGIGIGWLTATLVTGDVVRLVLGVVTLLFVARWLYSMVAGTGRASAHNPPAGVFWGAVSGFTSFVAHAGGPPYQVYTLPLRFDPKLYTGTSVIISRSSMRSSSSPISRSASSTPSISARRSRCCRSRRWRRWPAPMWSNACARRSSIRSPTRPFSWSR